MGDVYQSTRRFFLRKVLREFRPRWLSVVPNLAMHSACMALEGHGPLPVTVRHRWLRPISVALQLTRHCNYRCSFCNVNDLVSDGKGTEALSLGEFRFLLRRPLLSRCARVSFTGGEPLLAPDFFAIVAEAKRRIPIATLNTNFSLVKRHLDALNGSGLDMINISLYEPNQALVRQFAPKLDASIYRRLSFVVSGNDPFHDIRRVPEIARMAVELGFHALYLQNYLEGATGYDHSSPRANNPQPLASLTLGDTVVDDVRRRVTEEFGAKLAIAWPSFVPRTSPATRVRPRCRQPDTQILVDRDGLLAPCCILDPAAVFGSVHGEAGWNSPAFVAIRHGLKGKGAEIDPACRSCPFVDVDMFDA